MAEIDDSNSAARRERLRPTLLTTRPVLQQPSTPLNVPMALTMKYPSLTAKRRSTRCQIPIIFSNNLETANQSLQRFRNEWHQINHRFHFFVNYFCNNAPSLENMLRASLILPCSLCVVPGLVALSQTAQGRPL